jgi:hypothetical protein
MAKKKATAEGTDGQGENVSGYFRTVFAENPSWINTRSNDAVLARWLADHPGETEVPDRVKQNLSNIKSVLRQKRRKKRGRPKKSVNAAAETATSAVVVMVTPVEPPRKVVRGLGNLEEQIDECLTLARGLDREGLASVIVLLRRARNEVVWKTGETASE